MASSQGGGAAGGGQARGDEGDGAARSRGGGDSAPCWAGTITTIIDIRFFRRRSTINLYNTFIAPGNKQPISPLIWPKSQSREWPLNPSPQLLGVPPGVGGASIPQRDRVRRVPV